MNSPDLRLRVTHVDQLGAVLAMPAPCAVILALDSMPAHDAKAWEQKINRRLRTCGCDEATAALLINMGLLSAVAWWRWDVVSAAPVLSTLLGIGTCGLAIAAGKSLGRSLGRRRLEAMVRQLRAALVRLAAT